MCTKLDFIILYTPNKFSTKYRLFPKARCFEGLTSATQYGTNDNSKLTTAKHLQQFTQEETKMPRRSELTTTQSVP